MQPQSGASHRIQIKFKRKQNLLSLPPLTKSLPSLNSKRRPPTTELHLNNPPRLPTLNLINPPTNRHAIRHKLARLQKSHIVLNRFLQLGERQKVKVLGFEFSRGFLTVLHVSLSHNHLKSANLPKILLNNPISILILERQHPTASVLDKDDLVRAEELLRDDDGAEGVDRAGAGLFIFLV